ncbi:MAG: indole-3-glycerol phosphate synthase TrpC [bacterium]
MTILEEIVNNKRLEVAARKQQVSLHQLRESPAFHRQPYSLYNALRSKNPAVIAEIKKASPSRGVLREVMNVQEIAIGYAEYGAAAISVLTDQKYFQGSYENLRLARSCVELPILAKEFIVDPFQLFEAKSSGADAILLIASILSNTQLQELHHEAIFLGMEVLVEIHTPEELSRLDLRQVRMVGINNRDLKTFAVRLDTVIALAAAVPSDVIVVSESGILNEADGISLMKNGIHAMLIGEYFMRSEHPGRALENFLTALQRGGA